MGGAIFHFSCFLMELTMTYDLKYTKSLDEGKKLLGSFAL